MSTQRDYDQKSYELAEYFLNGWTHKPRDVEDLAVVIQHAVEDWFMVHDDVKEIQSECPQESHGL